MKFYFFSKRIKKEKAPVYSVFTVLMMVFLVACQPPNVPVGVTFDPYIFRSGERGDNRLYLLQLSPKWISDDGKTMYMAFSDAANGHSTYYMWNMQKIMLETEKMK